MVPCEFWYSEEKAISKAVEIFEKNYAPIVIIGHSLGAASAHLIALHLPRPSLLITLDGVSWWGHLEHLPHPGTGKRWINVNAIDNGWGPDWHEQGYADRYFPIDAEHGDIFKMLSPFREEVNEWIQKCDA